MLNFRKHRGVYGKLSAYFSKNQLFNLWTFFVDSTVPRHTTFHYGLIDEIPSNKLRLLGWTEIWEKFAIVLRRDLWLRVTRRFISNLFLVQLVIFPFSDTLKWNIEPTKQFMEEILIWTLVKAKSITFELLNYLNYSRINCRFQWNRRRIILPCFTELYSFWLDNSVMFLITTGTMTQIIKMLSPFF